MEATVAIVVSILINIGQLAERLYSARVNGRKVVAETTAASRRSAADAAAVEAHTQVERNTTAIDHWQGYAIRLEAEIGRLQVRLDAAEERERNWLVVAARQDEQIKYLTVEIGDVRAQLDAALRKLNTEA